MKTLILAATALILSTGAALANSQSSDNGFAVYQRSLAKAPVARIAADYKAGTDNGFAVYQQDAVKGSAIFLSGSAGTEDHIFSNNGRDAIEFRKTQSR